MSYLDSRVIILSSLHRRLLNETYKSKIEFQCNGLLKQDDNTEISLLNALSPLSFYAINYTNNMFKI